DRIMTGLERISLAGLRNDVTVTVVGGGATGVELAGSIADLRNIALAASYPEIDRDRVHVVLIEQAPALLEPFHSALRDYTRREPGRQAGAATADGGLPLPRQGHHGHHRVPLRGRRAPPPGTHARHARLAGLARAAPDHPARRPQSDLRAGQHVLALLHLAPRRRPHRRRWDDRAHPPGSPAGLGAPSQAGTI